MGTVNRMKVLVANRGEIACRIMHTLREMDVASVAVFTDVDAQAPHVFLADEAIALGPPTAYLEVAAILNAAAKSGATAIHPGYGFLSQSPALVEACTAAGVIFIGPSAAAMRALGDKRAARAVAEQHGVPVVPGATTCDSLTDAAAAVQRVGLPVLLKAAGGGGGKGMRLVQHQDDLGAAFAAAQREARAAFADDRLLVEKYIHPARHVEVQILAVGKRAIAVFERECSLQRRYQKIIEEAPATSLSPAARQGLHAAAVRLAEAVGYSSAGTVEFLVGADESYYFLEVNTRLQVEHPVTEALCGLDLVRCQVELAHGGSLPSVPASRGHAIEARLNAEDAYGGFLPAVGKILHIDWPRMPHVRVDAGVIEGQEVGVQYDPMLAKIIAWAPDREQARRRLLAALRSLTFLGVHTNQDFLMDVLAQPFFINGETFTTTIEAASWKAPAAPAWLAQAVAEAKAAGVGPDSVSANALAADRFSPWQSLGAFRSMA